MIVVNQVTIFLTLPKDLQISSQRKFELYCVFFYMPVFQWFVKEIQLNLTF